MDFFELESEKSTISSAELREKVEKARRIQQKRFANDPKVFCNAQMTTGMIQKYCKLDGLLMRRRVRLTTKNVRLLSGDTFRQYLERFRNEMDYIIIDTPPMLAASDAEVLAQYADTALLVVHQDMIYARDLNDCIDVLNRSNAEFMGYVLNDFV